MTEMATRRDFIAGSAALSVGSVARSAMPQPLDRIAADLATYIGFGNKQSGGPGDIASGDWLDGELARAGYSVQRQSFSAPFFTPTITELHCGEHRVTIWPQPIVVQTGPQGVTGPLVRIDQYGHADGPVEGAIAVVELPYARWSSTSSPAIRKPVAAAFAGGAHAAIVITNGPTGKVIALNADGHKPMFDRPVALLAPDDAGPFVAAAVNRTAARMIVDGAGGRRPAFNLIGRLDRSAAYWVVVSTPRSGWFGCAGERGSGIAVWLDLARWASRSIRGHNLAFVCNSGHEYEYLGAAGSLRTIAPTPGVTRFWLHLGAAVAARDWHELPGQWKPLPSIDSQRCLSVTPALVPLSRDVFAGHVGYEAPYASDVLAAGEIAEIIAAGYRTVAGTFGSHRYHHVAGDDGRCVHAPSVAATAAAFRRYLQRVL